MEKLRHVISSDAHYLTDIRDKDAFIELDDEPYSSALVRKNLIACIIIITLVFVIGLVFAELFLRPEETPQVTSQIYNEITHTYFINKSELIKFY